jgi:hypothetical protein
MAVSASRSHSWDRVGGAWGLGQFQGVSQTPSTSLPRDRAIPCSGDSG